MKSFEIYVSARGYTAVTNATRQRILQALAFSDADLTKLMRATGKAKPTLSAVHMRELLDDGLIEEYAHPTDARKKLYRLSARRIGVSNVSVEELRGAVREYSRRDPAEPSLPLGATLDIASSEGTPHDVLARNARRVGAEAAGYIRAVSLKDALPSIAGILDQAGIARPQRLDFDANEVELEPLSRAPKNVRMLAITIAGFFEGILRATVSASARVTGTLTAQNRVLIAVTTGTPNVS